MKSISLRLSPVFLIILGMATGCATVPPKAVNLTPEVVAANPSNIYTLSVFIDRTTMPKKGFQVQAVVGGNTYPMVQKSGSNGVFSFDYSMPLGSNRARFYYEVTDESGKVLMTSEIQDMRLTNRYVVELESNRAQPGSPISVLGRGFRNEDQIRFGTRNLPTRFISENQLSFDVPVLPGGRDYQVSLVTSSGVIPISMFRIDFSELRAMPARIVLFEGQTITLVLSIDRDAPPGDVALDLVVSDPDLIAFETAAIEEGTRSLAIQIEAGKPGEGTLTIGAVAHNTLTLPVEVRNRIAD
jgi:hypothetical protein